MLFPGSVAYVWHAGRHTSEVQQSLETSGFDMRAQIIWAKDRFALSTAPPGRSDGGPIATMSAKKAARRRVDRTLRPTKSTFTSDN